MAQRSKRSGGLLPPLLVPEELLQRLEEQVFRLRQIYPDDYFPKSRLLRQWLLFGAEVAEARIRREEEEFQEAMRAEMEAVERNARSLLARQSAREAIRRGPRAQPGTSPKRRKRR